MEVWAEMQLLVNITARSPRLLARGLPPGHVLFLRVYSSNSKGKSRSVRVEGYTLRMADKHPGVYFTYFVLGIFLQMAQCTKKVYTFIWYFNVSQEDQESNIFFLHGQNAKYQILTYILLSE